MQVRVVFDDGVGRGGGGAEVAGEREHVGAGVKRD
jgi:hypothetical protein